MDITALKNSAIGGYDKKSVHDFLEELSMAHSVKLAEMAEEKGVLMDKVAELEKKIASLEEALENSETEKNHVANAIVLAEKEAAKVLAAATSEADTLKSSAKAEAEALKTNAEAEAKALKDNTKKELRDEFELLKDLRLSAVQVINSYKDKLDAVIKRLGGDEE